MIHVAILHASRLDELDGDTEADIELAGNRVGGVLSGALSDIVCVVSLSGCLSGLGWLTGWRKGQPRLKHTAAAFS